MEDRLIDGQVDRPPLAEVDHCLGELARAARGEALLGDHLTEITRTAVRLVRNVEDGKVDAIREAFGQLARRGDPAIASRFHSMLSNLAIRRGRYDDALAEAK